MIPMHDTTTPEATTKSPEELVKELTDEFTPRIVKALKDLGADIDDEITFDQLGEILNNESAVLALFPAGTTLAELEANPNFEAFVTVMEELAEKFLELILGGLEDAFGDALGGLLG